MTGAAIATDGLCKRYGRAVALDDVALDVPTGSVFGLVGPNGAGKTTLLSILAGLRRPTSGALHLAVPRTRVAVLVDAPRFDPWLTGREVVDLARVLVASHVTPARVDDVIVAAGLRAAADRPSGDYSRGMLQRLGLAACVVGDPQVLILDEPCSALDPAGRREVLDTVVALRGRATVLLSTHLLTDVAEVCDTVGVLVDGRLVFQGPLGDLLASAATTSWTVEVREPVAPVRERLAAEPWVTAVRPVGRGRLVVEVGEAGDAERGLPRVLAEAGAAVVSLMPAGVDLERAFLHLTQRETA